MNKFIIMGMAMVSLGGGTMVHAQNLYKESEQRFSGEEIVQMQRQNEREEALQEQIQLLMQEIEELKRRGDIGAAQTNGNMGSIFDQVAAEEANQLDSSNPSAGRTPEPVDIRSLTDKTVDNSSISGGKIQDDPINRERLNALKLLDRRRMLEAPRDVELTDVSWTALPQIRPKVYQINDLVTIQISEAHTSRSSSSLSTGRENTWDHEIAALPNFDLHEIINGTMRRGNLLDGATSPLTLDVETSRDRDSSGSYNRNDSINVQLTARVVDVKPNQNIVVEAVRVLESGGQTTKIVLTGIARYQDIDAQNQILSTRLANLKVRVTHGGKIEENSKDGVGTQLLDFIINF